MIKGILSEYAVVKIFQYLGIKIASKTNARFKIMEGKCKPHFNTRTKNIKQILTIGAEKIRFITRNKKYVHLEHCSIGSSINGNPSTADLTLYNKSMKNPIGISVKCNNFSFKHQRPSCLPLQIGMQEHDAGNFRKRYSAINDIYYNTWCKKYVNFREVPILEKRRFYNDVNTLTLSYLENASKYEMYRFMRFIMDINTQYIVHCDVDNQDIRVYKKLSIPASSITFELKSNSIIQINIGAMHISMRLHNSATEITRKLKIKYDTKIYNCLKEIK